MSVLVESRFLEDLGYICLLLVLGDFFLGFGYYRLIFFIGLWFWFLVLIAVFVMIYGRMFLLSRIFRLG